MTLPDGRKVRRTISTGQRDKANAETAATRIESEDDAGQLDDFIERKKLKKTDDAHYGDFAATYVTEVSSKKRYDHAVVNDSHNLRLSVAFFGSTLMADITADDCAAFVASARAAKSGKGKPYKANCLRNYINAMRALFAEAIKRKLVTRDPWEDVNRRQVVPRGTVRDRVVQPDEQAAFLTHADPEAARAFIVMTGAGLREDELLRVEPRNCDFHNFVIKCTGNMVKGKDSYDCDPETVVREVPMWPAVAQALQEQIHARAGGLGAGGRRVQGPRLWNLSRTGISDKMKEGRLAAHVASFTEHDCRRTFGTRCAEAGVKPHRLQAWMGHASISTTMKFYVHEQRAESKAEAARLDIGLPSVVTPINMGRKKTG